MSSVQTSTRLKNMNGETERKVEHGQDSSLKRKNESFVDDQTDRSKKKKNNSNKTETDHHFNLNSSSKSIKSLKPAPQIVTESAITTTTTGKKKRSDWNEIEMLFQDGKDMKKKVQQEDMIQRQKDDERRKQRRKQRRQEEQEQQHHVENNNNNNNNNRDNHHHVAASWVDDGLGGKYNTEGYTGRVEDGIKIFKAHLLSKPGAGTTPSCPFDCDCCFI